MEVEGIRMLAAYMPLSVVAIAWMNEDCAFVMKEFIHNGGFVITMKFPVQFELGRHDTIKFGCQTLEYQVLH